MASIAITLITALVLLASSAHAQQTIQRPGGSVYSLWSEAAGVLTATGNITITKQDPSIIFNAGQSGDTKFWLGVQDDNGNDDDDTLQIGTGTTPGSGSLITVTKAGQIKLLGGSSSLPSIIGPDAQDDSGIFFSDSGQVVNFVRNGVVSGSFGNSAPPFTKFESTGFGYSDAMLFRDAAQTLAQRNGTNAQTFNVYGTFTDASNYERASLSHTTGSGTVLAAQTAGTGADNLNITLTPAGTGGVIISTLSGTGTEYACLDSTGKLVRSASPCGS